MSRPFCFCCQRSVLISDSGERGRKEARQGLRQGPMWYVAGTTGPQSVAFDPRTGGPFDFAITRFPLFNGALVPGLPLPGRHGGGRCSPWIFSWEVTSVVSPVPHLAGFLCICVC